MRITTLGEMCTGHVRRLSIHYTRKMPSLRVQAIRDSIMEYLDDWYADGKTFSPTIREIGEHVGLSSSSTVHSHIKALRQELRIAPAVKGRPRCIVPMTAVGVRAKVLGLARVVADTTQDESARELLTVLEGMFGESKRCED